MTVFFLKARSLEEILAGGGEDVKQSSGLEAGHAVRFAGGGDVGIADGELACFVSDGGEKASCKDVGDLRVRMAVHRADGALFEAYLHGHYFFIVGEDLARKTAAEVGSFCIGII